MSLKKSQLATLIGAALLASTVAPVAVADGHRLDRTVIYLTRHAEKMTVEDDMGVDNCAPDSKGKIRCEEALSALGEKRAELLAEWFEDRGIVDQVTHVISSDKQRTRQTVAPTAQKVMERNGNLFPVEIYEGDIFEDRLFYNDGLEVIPEYYGEHNEIQYGYQEVLPPYFGDFEDGIVDGVMQIPASDANLEGNELTSNGKSVQPMTDAILALPAGSVAVVAAHSGTIYKILGGEDTDGNANTGEDQSVGLGIDTTIGNNFDAVTLFPKNESNGKVRDFGDLWKIVINNNNGTARVVWRKSLQLQRLQMQDQTTNRRGVLQNRYW